MCIHQCDVIVRHNRARKRVASGTRPKAGKASDTDEVISQLGGFADDEDDCSVAADREDIVGPAKSGRRSATVCTSAVLLVFQMCG